MAANFLPKFPFRCVRTQNDCKNNRWRVALPAGDDHQCCARLRSPRIANVPDVTLWLWLPRGLQRRDLSETYIGIGVVFDATPAHVLGPWALCWSVVFFFFFFFFFFAFFFFFCILDRSSRDIVVSCRNTTIQPL